MATPLPFDAPGQAWARAAARGIDWLEAQLDGGGRLRGALHDLGSCYKWPLALASAGRMALGRRLFAALVADFMTADGDFRSGEEKCADPLYGQIADSYTNTWPIVAARVFDRPDVGAAGLDCLRRRQVASTGGYLTGRPGQFADSRQDIVTIAGCGNALLAWDRVDEAALAGDCLLRILALQGGPAEPFHLYVDGAGRLLRGDLGIPQVLARIDPSQPGQVYVYWGMAAVFLARLHLVTGQARFLAGARAYFARHDACGDAVYAGLGCCKTGWAASVLFRATGQEPCRRVVHRCAAELVRVQAADGSWPRPGLSAVLNCDTTGELVYHLCQYGLELGGPTP